MDSYEYILKNLTGKSRSRGYITYDDINDTLPRENLTVEQLDDLLATLIASNVVIVDTEPHTELPRPPSLPSTEAHINELMEGILERERAVHEILFRMPLAVAEGLKALKRRRGSNIAADDPNCSRLMSVYRKSPSDPQHVSAIADYFRKSGLSRGDTWQIYSDVSAALDELLHADGDEKRQELTAFFDALPADARDSLAFIKVQQREINKMREDICKAYTPIIVKMSPGGGVDDKQQDGFIALLEAMDSYTYIQPDFLAFTSDKISASLSAMLAHESEQCGESQHLAMSTKIESPVLAEEPPATAQVAINATHSPHPVATGPGGAFSGIDKITPIIVSDSRLLVKSKPLYQRTARELVRTIDVRALLAESASGFEGGREPQGMTAAGGAHVDAGRRLSARARIVGLRAEAFVIKHLIGTLSEEENQSLCWVSKEGITPGWDIEYVAASGQPFKIEVKGTEGKIFPSIDISGNEWKAAEEQRASYWLYVVTECSSSNPHIAKINDPYSMAENGHVRAFPLIWRLEMISECPATE